VFRGTAVEALRGAGIPWRLAYTSSTIVGIRTAVRAGLGVTIRTIEMLGPDLKVLGETDGLPRLPDVTFYLYLRDSPATSAAAREVFRSIAALP
jgi:DNA-binding transcriptional LysR family regulator